MLKKFLIGTLVVLAFVATQTASAADFGSTTLKVGSKGEAVKALQTLVGASPVDGSFGPATKIKVMAWQANNGLKADGAFGAASKAKANGGSVVSTVSGCTAGAAFSATTGLPCTTVSSTVPGCAAGAAFSSTTGAACAGTPAVVTGGAGNASLATTTTEVETTVSEGDVARKIQAFKVEASDSDILVRNLKVTLENTPASTSSTRLERYMTNVDIYMGSVKVGSASVSDFSKDGSVYTKNFTLSNAVVKMGASNKATFWVAVSAANSIDSGDIALANWKASISDVRYSDGTGMVLTSSYTQANKNFTFQSLTSSGDLKLNITKGTSSPVAGNVKVSSTGTTGSILMNQFKLKATGSEMTVSKVSVTATSSTSSLASVLSELTVKVGTQTATNVEIVTTTANNQVFTFSFDTDVVIAKDATVTFDVLAKVNKVGTAAFPQGSTLKVDYTGATVEDKLGDTVGSSITSGSALGETQTFFSEGVNASNFVSTVSTTTNTNGTTTKQTYTVSFSLTAFGNNYYIPKAGLVYAIEKSDGTAGVATSTASALSSTATTEGSTYLVADGETKTFTATVEVTPGATSAFQHIQLSTVQYGLTAGGSMSTYTFAPAQNYETADRSI